MSEYLIVVVALATLVGWAELGYRANKANLTLREWMKKRFTIREHVLTAVQAAPVVWAEMKKRFTIHEPILTAVRGRSDIERIAVMFLLVGLTVLGAPAAIGWLNGCGHKWGDPYDSVNALFAGLAAVGVIATLIFQSRQLQLQREDLNQNTQELKNQAEALNDQANLMRWSAKLSALPALIRAEVAEAKLHAARLGFKKITLDTPTDVDDVRERVSQNADDLAGEDDATYYALRSLSTSLAKLARYYKDADECYRHLDGKNDE